MNFNTSELYTICKRRSPGELRRFIQDFPNFNLETKLDQVLPGASGCGLWCRALVGCTCVMVWCDVQHDNTALHCVAARNCEDCVDVLLKAGAKADSIGGVCGVLYVCVWDTFRYLIVFRCL